MRSMKHKQLVQWVWVAICALALSSGPWRCFGQPTAAAPGSERVTNALPVEVAAAETDEDAAAVGEATNTVEKQPVNRVRNSRPRDLVVFGHNVEVKPGESVKDLVVLGGTATVRGEVRGDVVAVMGSVDIETEAPGDVVAVMGNIKLGTNATIRGNAVAVAGNIRLGPNARIHGDSVAVGGAVEPSEGASIGGQIVGLPGFGWLGDWVEQCALKLRPLAPQIGWLWVVTGAVFLVYLLIVVAFPRPVQACVEEISNRPATTLLIGLLTKLLIPVIMLILLITGIGVFVIPFLVAVVMLAGMVGKIALLQYLGQQIGRQFGLGALERPALAFILGWIILIGLYLVPVLGLVVFGVTGLWALGAAVMAMFGGSKREMPEQPAPPAAQSTKPSAPQAAAGLAAEPQTGPAKPMSAEPTGSASAAATIAAAASGFAAAPSSAGEFRLEAAVPLTEEAKSEAGQAPGPIPVPAQPPPVSSDALTFPRAGFWERIGAAFLDVVLVSILGSLVGGAPWGFLVALAYFAGMWAWRGTTIGGIVLNLKVVRFDDKPLTFAVALVRGLAAAFSVIVICLGFLWIAWDPEKQAWHDKIAGTVVVRLPRGMPLVCL